MITIAAAVFLLAAAAAACSQARTYVTGIAQKAIEAPRPSGVAQTKPGVVQQVVCTSAKSCAALGASLYTEQAGRWKASKMPSLSHTGGTNLRSLACPAAGRCVAVGMAGLHHMVEVTESGRQWKPATLELPSDALAIDYPVGPSPLLGSVSCSSPRNCLAVGVYIGSDRAKHPLLVAENSGTWGTGQDVDRLLPANAGTSFDPDNPDAGAGLSLVSCPAAGACTAVGSYSNKDASDADYPWVVSESDGNWGSGAEARLPANASTSGDLSAGASPFFGFTGLSCPSAGNCTAVGGYENRQGAEEGLILRERNGVWSRGVRSPLPPKGVPNTEPNEFNSPLTSVACGAPDDCAAVGWYVLGPSGARHGLLLRERGGTWKAFALALPPKAKAPGGVFLTSVACPSRGNCVAVGYYGNRGHTRGLVVRERRGNWGRAVDAALPKGAAPAGKEHTFLNSVSCPSASRCTAGGYYSDRSGRTQGLLLNLRLG
ncbi:MAG TPA: hypothetical protein VJ716_04105 [Gaiellaceae bacterium]|nr:hypothetical protein [Gaiellaceae bacterium]